MKKILKHIFLYLFNKKYRKMNELHLKLQNAYFVNILPNIDLPKITLLSNPGDVIYIYRLDFIDSNFFTLELSKNNSELKISITEQKINTELVDRVYLIRKELLNRCDEILLYFNF